MSATVQAPGWDVPLRDSDSIPGPGLRATPTLIRMLFNDRLGLMSKAAQYGDMARLRIGPRTLYVVNNPDHARHVLADNASNYVKGIGLVEAKRAIGNGLLTSDGELWRRQRRAIQPAFQARRIAEQAPVVADEALGLVTRLAAYVGSGPVDVVPETTALTLGVLGRALLDTDLTGYDGVAEAFESVQDQAIFEMVTLGILPLWLPLPRQRRFRRARARLEQVVRELVDSEARRPGGSADGMMTRIVAAAAQQAGRGAGSVQIRDELITVLLAGHETTASTLSWALHLIGGDGEVWERLHEEAVAVLGDRSPVQEDLRRLTYTAMVVQEVMRLYPPVWILPRRAVGADVVGGYRVPAGADVVVSPYILHRNARFWSDPERFDPERFSPTAAQRHTYAYLPFGAGPRFCVGNNLAMMEAVFAVACIVRGLRFTGQPGRKVEAEPMLSLRVRGGLPMLFSSAAG